MKAQSTDTTILHNQKGGWVRINLVPGCRGPQAEEPVLSLELPSQEPGKTGWSPMPMPGPEHRPQAPARGKARSRSAAGRPHAASLDAGRSQARSGGHKKMLQIEADSSNRSRRITDRTVNKNQLDMELLRFSCF